MIHPAILWENGPIDGITLLMIGGHYQMGPFTFGRSARSRTGRKEVIGCLSVNPQSFPWEDIMRRLKLLVLALALGFSTVFVASPALADKPVQTGGKKAEKHNEKGNQGKQKQGKEHDRAVSGQEDEHGVKASRHFSKETQIFIHKYYGDNFRSGKCPPGLAKKNNGCMPPGQAKKWMIGRPLPRDVLFYDLPPEIVVQLGPVPSRHRFVRVASDILMIAVGTGMVVDAIEDIGKVMDR
jgi:hypothetical protein